jgi:hypothetical protein
MPRHTVRLTTGFLMAVILLSACQPAAPVVPTAAPTPVPPTAAPTATAVPLHPEVKADAPRIDFSNTTMSSGPGDIAPGTSHQVVFSAAAGQKLKIEMSIESGSGTAFSLWGADNTVVVPETSDLTVWAGALPTGQDYYLNFRNTSQQPIGFQLTLTMTPMVLPEATRIQFQPNTTGWYTPGDVQPNEKLTFVLGAMQGQQMTVNLTTDPVEAETFVYIWSADGTVYTLMAPTKDWSGLLPASQDYFVEVRSYAKQPVQYTLSVNIPVDGAAANVPAIAPEAAPQTAFGARIAVDKPIRFAEGPLAVELNGSVINGERDRYSLSAMAGENLEVIITSTEANAVFTIIGPDNNPLPGTEEGKDTNNWSVPIQMEGTYSIIVGSTRGNATYTLKVNI